jgi:hypothetical protein
MNGKWYVFGGVTIGVAGLLTVALMKMARESDRAARRVEKIYIPLSDLMVTQAGNGVR